MKTAGQVGYEAYSIHTGGKTFDGRDMPLWDELPDDTKLAWGAAATAIAEYKLGELKLAEVKKRLQDEEDTKPGKH